MIKFNAVSKIFRNRIVVISSINFNTENKMCTRYGERVIEIMKLSTINLFVKDSSKNLRSNATTSIASIAAIMSALFILGMFLLFILDLRMGIMGIYTQFEIIVDLKADIEVTDYQNIYNKIKAVNGITDITFENNAPLSASYIIKVNGSEDIPKIISLLNGLQGINKISSGKNVPRRIFAITKAIQLIGTILFLILMAASFFIIKNTIKLAIYPRLNEISIMQYLGATYWFIRCSFIFEGIILGFLGALSAVIALFYLYSFIFTKVASFLETNLINLISPSFIFTTMSWSFILIGIILSSFGSILVVNKFLKI